MLLFVCLFVGIFHKIAYYWGKISKKYFQSNNSGGGEKDGGGADDSNGGGSSWKFNILFFDGDTTDGLTSKYLHRMKETLEMMKDGTLTSDEPPADYMAEFTKELSSSSSLRRSPDKQQQQRRRTSTTSSSGSSNPRSPGGGNGNGGGRSGKSPKKTPISEGPPDDDLGEGLDWTEGWIKRVYRRMDGDSAERTDKYWHSPGGYKFRSLVQVRKYMKALELLEGDETKDSEYSSEIVRKIDRKIHNSFFT